MDVAPRIAHRIIYLNLPWYTSIQLTLPLLVCPGLSWSVLVSDGLGILLYSMVLNGIQRYSMVSDGLEWSQMVSHGLTWKQMVIDGLWWTGSLGRYRAPYVYGAKTNIIFWWTVQMILPECILDNILCLFCLFAHIDNGAVIKPPINVDKLL